MAWKVDGKIAAHFPGTTGGLTNRDTYRILFAPASASQASDLTDIEKVYFIPAGASVTQSNLQDYLVWHRYDAGVLVAGSTDVAIEYLNTVNDVTVTSLGIFTADTPASTTQCIKIIHESGTVLAQISSDDGGVAATKYGLQGYVRTCAVNNIVFHKNQKYYIMYTDGRSSSDYHPAYFQNETGNYKAFKNSDSKSTADLNDCAPYLGWITELDSFITANENALMVWNGDNSLLNVGTVYVRNRLYQGSYAGKIGNNENLSQTLLNQILNLADGSVFLWGGWDFTPSGTNILKKSQLHQKNSTYSKNDYVGVISNRNELLDLQYSIGKYGIAGTTIWRKKNNVVVDDTMNFDDYSGKQVPAAVLIQKSYNASANKKVMTYGSYDRSQKNGYIYTLDSGFSYDFTIDQNDQLHGYTRSNPPNSWVINRIYYLEEEGSYPDAGWATVGLNRYYEETDSQGNVQKKFQDICVYSDNLSDIFTIDTQSALDATEEISLGPTIDIIGQVSNLAKTNYTGNYISNDCRNITTSTDKKFYLEVNGDEV